ncbi:MAG: tetratricopeptide repeat protein [Burkholderiaceae bacterium]
MFRCLRLIALIGLCINAGALHAQVTMEELCARGSALYGSGQLTPAFRIFMACAIGGDSVAQYSAAMMMRSGESTEDGSPNLFGARVFLEQSAAQGYVQAIYALGKEYDVGSSAFPRDISMATEMFRHAAMLGHVDAQVELATQYLLGRGGVPQDDHVAAQWYERAAEAGHWGAQYLIASMYEHGNGVGRDEKAALLWYERASQGGDEVAPLKVEQLRSRLAPKTRMLPLD